MDRVGSSEPGKPARQTSAPSNTVHISGTYLPDAPGHTRPDYADDGEIEDGAEDESGE